MNTMVVDIDLLKYPLDSVPSHSQLSSFETSPSQPNY